MAALWNEEERLGSVFLNGAPRGRHNVKDGKSSYRAMNNSHSIYIIGAQSKTNAESGGKTLHGFIKELKVFKRALNKSEILTEASLSKATGTFDCLVFLIIYLFIKLYFISITITGIWIRSSPFILELRGPQRPGIKLYFIANSVSFEEKQTQSTLLENLSTNTLTELFNFKVV